MGIAISLQVQDRHVYIVGGGQVALRKAKQFMREGAIVHVIAKAFLPEFQTMEQLDCIQQPFTWEWVQHACYLMYVASDDTVLNQQIVLEAKQKNIVCGCAVFNEHSGFYSMIEEKKTNIEFALSTKGKCPGADRQLLLELDESFQELNQRVSILQELRKSITQNRKENMAMLSKLSLENLEILQNAYTRKCSVLLLAYHGVADVPSMQSILTSFHQQVEREVTSHKVMFCFLSSKIIEKAKKQGHRIDEVNGLVDALRMLDISYTIQPMLLQRGTWFQTVATDQSLGECLLEQVQDVQDVYEILKKNNSQKNCLFVYHDVEHHLFDCLQLQSGDQFLPLSKLPISLSSMVQIVPLFLFLGYHVHKDIKQQIPSFNSFEAVGLMEIPEIQSMFIRKIHKLIENT